MTAELTRYETLPQLVMRALEPARDAVFLERVDGAWTPISSELLLQRVRNVAAGLADAGVRVGDRVALIAPDGVDWIVAALGTLFAGCVVVPIYPTQALDYTHYILAHSQATLLFVDSAGTVERLGAGDGVLPTPVVFDSASENGMRAFEARGAATRRADPGLPEARQAALTPSDLAVLIYTSGTTGNPKGVMLSHDNVAFDARSTLAFGLAALQRGSDVLSVLPFSHIYEHTILYVYLLAGVRCYICHDPSELVDDLRDVRPSVMTAVPRIFDRVLAAIRGGAMKRGGVQAKLVPWALATGREYARAETFADRVPPGLRLRAAVARRLVLRKIRAGLGLDRLKFLASGSAALHVDTAMTFLGFGIPIMQGYGLTETSPVITASNVESNLYGASGRPIGGVEIRIAPDGEILTRGRHVMLGYYKDPQATAGAIVDGWFHTGDIGALDADGFLHIEDRKGEIFKTGTGKWISPGRIEAAIKRSVYVAQVLVVGNGRPHPAALVCPNWDLVRHRLSLPPGASNEELADRDDVRAFLSSLAVRQTESLAPYERIRRIVVIPQEFSVENGALSPSMKIKRRVVESRYADEIERAYADPAAPEPVV